MPEGHSIHRLARRHRRALGGHVVSASSPQGRFAEGAALIDGQRLDATDAWGKHLFHRYGDLWLHVHLGLYGKFRDGTGPAPEPRRRAAAAAGDRRSAGSTCAGPTACELLGDAGADAVLARLGPDPLRRGADPAPAAARIARSRRADRRPADGPAGAGRGRQRLPRRDPVPPPGEPVPARAATSTRPLWRAMWDDLVRADARRRPRRDASSPPSRDDRERPAGAPAPHGRPLRLPPRGAAVPALRDTRRGRDDGGPQPVLVPGLPSLTGWALAQVLPSTWETKSRVCCS